MVIEVVIGTIFGSGAVLLGYHVGRNHERQAWSDWLDVKIPRLQGQRPPKKEANMKFERIMAMVIGLVGFAILWMALGWLPTLGVVLCLWGNNWERETRGV